jgi:predicted nucleotidyltransferase
MENRIAHFLNEIENQQNIKILLACETGSRAWGFPSPDSDYDVRIIYCHTKDWYLNLTEPKDSIDLMFDDNMIDITGWELRKTLRLLLKSNASVLERIQSPIIYQQNEQFVKEIKGLSPQYYSRIATLHHYLGLAKKCFTDIDKQPEFKLKKFFYALRAAVNCIWILDREDVPPIVFQEALAGISMDITLVERIKELVEMKAAQSEAYFHSDEAELVRFIKKAIKRAQRESTALPASKGSIETMNEFFIKTLG